MPANAGRENLRCPFGCRELHRRQQSNRRSSEYYRTDAGRAKKKRLNARRQKQKPEPPTGASSARLPAAPPRTTLEIQTPPAADASPRSPTTPSLSLQLPGLELTEAMLEHSPVLDYVLLLFWLIARRRLTREELLERLRERMRQHSLVHLRRRDYVVHFLGEEPP